MIAKNEEVKSVARHYITSVSTFTGTTVNVSTLPSCSMNPSVICEPYLPMLPFQFIACDDADED